MDLANATTNYPIIVLWGHKYSLALAKQKDTCEVQLTTGHKDIDEGVLQHDKYSHKMTEC